MHFNVSASTVSSAWSPWSWSFVFEIRFVPEDDDGGFLLGWDDEAVKISVGFHRSFSGQLSSTQASKHRSTATSSADWATIRYSLIIAHRNKKCLMPNSSRGVLFWSGLLRITFLVYVLEGSWCDLDSLGTFKVRKIAMLNSPYAFQNYQ